MDEQHKNNHSTGEADKIQSTSHIIDAIALMATGAVGALMLVLIILVFQ